MCDHIPVLLLCCAIQVALGQDVGGPLVDTKYGKLQGTTLKVKETDRTVDVFYGIPFAKPPVGSLRSAEPQPPEPWKTVRDATKPPSMCLQNMKLFKQMLKLNKIAPSPPPTSKGCLDLNVFTPSDRGPNDRLPVMVFIHSGRLAMETAAAPVGSALSAYENVVLIAVQYRTGILRFLNPEDEQRASGNYGYMDLIAALRWVQENIENFGGDPESVTIFGESACAASISALVLSPMAKGLFHRAIAQSRTALMPGFLVTSAEEQSFYRDLVANESRCEPSSLADCLRKKSEQEIFSIISALDFLPIPACVDGVFLPKTVEEILAAKENNKVPFIIGVNEQEYVWMATQGLDAEYMNGLENKSIQLELRRFLFQGLDAEYMNGLENKSIQLELRRFLFQDEVLELGNLDENVVDDYFGDSEAPLKIRERFLELQSDFMFVNPALKTAKLHQDNFTEEEKKLSKIVMIYWANFARTGNPNGPGLVRWSQYDKNESYLQIDIQQESAQRFKEEKFIFWNNFVEKISEFVAGEG